MKVIVYVISPAKFMDTLEIAHTPRGTDVNIALFHLVNPDYQYTHMGQIRGAVGQIYYQDPHNKRTTQHKHTRSLPPIY
jgi:hypothetical protein